MNCESNTFSCQIHCFNSSNKWSDLNCYFRNGLIPLLSLIHCPKSIVPCPLSHSHIRYYLYTPSGIHCWFPWGCYIIIDTSCWVSIIGPPLTQFTITQSKSQYFSKGTQISGQSWHYPVVDRKQITFAVWNIPDSFCLLLFIYIFDSHPHCNCRRRCEEIGGSAAGRRGDRDKRTSESVRVAGISWSLPRVNKRCFLRHISHWGCIVFHFTFRPARIFDIHRIQYSVVIDHCQMW